MTRPAKTLPVKIAPPLADEKIRQITEQLLEVIDSAGEIDEFAGFEEKVLEIGNKVCQQAIKKNSRR